MAYIKSLHIEGFKKFKKLDIIFNENMNILVGENEAGKSTILNAIKTVLNQQYKNVDKSIIKELLNSENINTFKNNPSIKTLPRIYIEMDLNLDPKDSNAEYFFGEHNIDKTGKFGISFTCEFDKELGTDLIEEINKGKIPYEYYNLNWITFRGKPYQMIKKPFGFIAIDTSNNDTQSSFNYFNKSLFASKYNENIKMKAKNSFREKVDEAFEFIDLPKIDENRKFGIDSKKIVLEAVLSVFENDISLENHGSGMENLIKTQIALDKSKSGLDVVLIEEPESHLSFLNLRKMINEIANKKETSQIIISTHDNLIASGLNLKNVFWITSNNVISLSNVEDKVANFFVKASDNSFLQLLLSDKAILVEGATECILLPKFYEQITERKIEEDGIAIIPCNGVAYKNYLKVVANTNKKIAVLTDNDKSSDKLKFAVKFNNISSSQKIFMGTSVVDEWTWEACLYKDNKDKLTSIIKVNNSSKYLFHNEDYGPILGKMLNNKAEVAYQILISDEKFVVPKYVEEAILWLNE
ncbi:MAG: AAA family ATPase [Oscillospiraceae bacterium]|nr:AAA family ATPase [Oscillospiraceae bacterium]